MMPSEIEPAQENDNLEMLVVFIGQTECRYLRWLKQGFRHCFIAQRQGGFWIICDPLKHRIDIMLLDLPSNFNSSRFYYERSHMFVEGHASRQIQSHSSLFYILTCVAVAKRIIGLRSFLIFTPWQLFCCLVSMIGHWRVVK